MVTSTSKHDITKGKHKHCMLKLNNKKELIMIEENLDNDIINDDVINYWHKGLQLLVNDENVLNPCEWLNNQHMAIAMQMLYFQKLESLKYQQHTYAIIGTIDSYLSKCLQHIFINNNHWPFVHIHATTLDFHCIIYDSNTSKRKNLPNDIVQLLIKLINVKHLLYMHANVMQHLDGLSCGIFKITCATNITFAQNLEQFIYIIPKT